MPEKETFSVQTYSQCADSQRFLIKGYFKVIEAKKITCEIEICQQEEVLEKEACSFGIEREPNEFGLE